jgi:hypothetical protein
MSKSVFFGHYWLGPTRDYSAERSVPRFQRCWEGYLTATDGQAKARIGRQLSGFLSQLTAQMK